MRLFAIRALYACALLMIAAPLLAQKRAATPERISDRAAVARTIQALRMMRGVDYRMAPTPSRSGVNAKAGASLQAQGDGSIAGTVGVPDASQGPATVIAFAADSLKESFFVSDVQTDGSYVIENVPAGDYYVLAQTPDCMTEFFDDVASLDSATVVTVRGGSVASDIDFSLELIPVGAGSISGKVLVDVGGDAIHGAAVWVMSLDNPMLGGWAEADASGDYVVDGLFSGDYIVQASAPGFIPELYDNAQTLETATLVTVTEPGTTEGIDFALGNGATISGRVLDGDGNPLAGVMVDAMPDYRLTGPDTLYPYPGFGGMAITDGNGDYTLGGLPDGEYLVSATYWGGVIGVQEWYDDATTIDEAIAVAASAGAPRSDVDFVLEVPTLDGSISGVVTDTAGNPIEGAMVMVEAAFDGGFGIRAGAVTDADGSYTVEGLPDGEFLVSAMAQAGWSMTMLWWENAASPDMADPVKLTGGVSDVASVDFALPLERGTASISGTARLADGSPAIGAQIGVIVTDPVDSMVVFGASAVTDMNGAYAIRYLPAGTYLVHAAVWQDGRIGTEWYLDAADPSSATPVMLADGESRTGVDFSLELVSFLGRVAGRVTHDVTGAPIANAFVELAPAAYTFGRDDFAYWPQYALTDSEGRYAIDGVWAGEYFASVVADGAYEYYDGVDNPDDALLITVTGDRTTTVDFGLSPIELGDGSISGVVSSVDGTRINAAVVVAMPEQGTNETFFPAVAASNGAYSIAGLPDGRYYVYAYSPEHIGEFYENAWDYADATIVEIEDGGIRTGVDFGLQSFGCIEDDTTGIPGVKGGIVHGTVTDNAGRPLGDANVYVFDGAKEPVASVRTRGDGRYEIPGLPAGDGYRVMASSVGYATEYNSEARELEEAEPMQVRLGRNEVNFELARGTSGVVGHETRASGISIAGSFPNPFTTTTTLRFALARSMDVHVTVVDARGTVVAELHDGMLDGGAHELRWDGRGGDGTLAGSGLYFLRIDNGASVQSRPLTLTR